MDRLFLLPETSSIGIKSPRRALRANVPGPMGRFKATRLREPFIVKCQWQLTSDEYKTWFEFFSLHKAIPFLIELLIEDFKYHDYKVVFDGSYRMTRRGTLFVVDQNLLAERTSA